MSRWRDVQEQEEIEPPERLRTFRPDDGWLGSSDRERFGAWRWAPIEWAMRTAAGSEQRIWWMSSRETWA
ncbi:MAG TPA: hypothetical protein VK390_12275 [Propionibacteriaceae bacterium]|nr:hypothetical protein [Propionibacteriaceae bacterium]